MCPYKCITIFGLEMSNAGGNQGGGKWAAKILFQHNIICKLRAQKNWGRNKFLLKKTLAKKIFVQKEFWAEIFWGNFLKGLKCVCIPNYRVFQKELPFRKWNYFFSSGFLSFLDRYRHNFGHSPVRTDSENVKNYNGTYLGS